MRTSARHASAWVTALAPVLLVACGALRDGGDRAPDVDPDAAAPPFDTPDAYAPRDASDGSQDAPGDAPSLESDAPGDVLTPPSDALDAAPLVAATSGFVLDGITTDGWLIYEDDADPSQQHVSAVSLAGGQPVRIASTPLGAATWRVQIQGAAALVYAAVPSGTDTIVTLTLWTNATGAHAVTSVRNYQPARLSADGSRVVYETWDPSLPRPPTYHYVMANTDLTSPITLYSYNLTAFDIDSPVYVTKDRFVITSNFEGDANTPAMSTDSYTNDGARTHLFDTWVDDVAGESVLVYGPQGNLTVQLAGGGPVTTIVPSASQTSDTVQMTPDGTRVVYADPANQYWSASTSTPSAAPLANTMNTIPSGTTGEVRVSPDGSQFARGTEGGSWFVASTTAGNALPVHPLTGKGIAGLTFARDSQYLFFTDALDLEVAPVATGAPVRIGQVAACQAPCASWLPAHDATVVYLSGTDLVLADANDPVSSRTIARSVAQFVLDPTGTIAAYWVKGSASSERSGLYATPLP